jgi:hypothetical protein
VQAQRRVIEAFGTLERAVEALDGQIHYQLQQPVPPTGAPPPVPRPTC